MSLLRKVSDWFHFIVSMGKPRSCGIGDIAEGLGKAGARG